MEIIGGEPAAGTDGFRGLADQNAVQAHAGAGR